MKVHHDDDADVLHITTEKRVATAASLLDDPNVAVELATEDGHDIVGLIVMWASSYVRSGHDAETDTLLIGKAVCDPELITENGDLVAYWQVDDEDPDGYRDPIGVAVRRASVHLAAVSAELAGVPA